MGRKHTLTDELVDRLMDLISQGYTYRDASATLGIPENTFQRWRHESETAKSGPRAYLAKQLPLATAQFKHFHLNQIRESNEWRSHAWILERRFPQEYASRMTVELMLEDKLNAFCDCFDAITGRTVVKKTVVQSEDFSPDNQPPE